MKQKSRSALPSALRWMAIASFLAPPVAVPFAGEDFLEGNPWHHEAISEDALRARNFGADAVDEVAWNADYVDSYLYNPLWWIQGGLSRFKASMATFDELEKVHFDDNFSGDHIRRTWRRYLTGCMAGLVWAAERNDIAAGRNLIGVTLHAIQDFYSHSNWIDSPDRRDLTWFEFEKAARDRLAIYAGAYEHPEQTGVKPHGKITPGCSVLKQALLKPFLEPACTAFSPLHNSRMCDLYEECKTASPIQPSLYGLQVPSNVLYASPPGMNLDARWSAAIGVRVRGLADLNGGQAFDLARGLAMKASEQWLQIVEEKLEKMGFGSYVNQLKNASTTTRQEQMYEGFGNFPYQFLSAGTYPPDLRTPEEEWYLRVQIRTGTESGAGTDADIYLEADGKRFLLDYSPRTNPILNHNDFESGDDEAYTVGPFEKLPAQIRLFNDRAGGPEVARALAQSAIDSVRGLADTVGDVLLSLVAGHADKVGANRMFWNAEQLDAVPAAGRAFTIAVNGGDEGHYRLDGRILKTAESPAGAPEPWHEFRVQLTSLYCIREGSVDRLSPSEEPYVLALLVPFPGNIAKYKTAPIPDTDTGETKRIGYTFPTVRIPKAHGMLSLPISIWESDSESETSRRQQLDRFAGEANQRTGPARQGVRDAIGAAVAADWQVGSVTVYAFNRGGNVLKTGKVHDASINAWIKGDARRTFALDAAKLKSFPAVDARTIDVIESPKPSPIGYGYEFDGEWDVQFYVNSASILQKPLRTKIRLASMGNRVEGFYEGPVLEVPHLTLRPGRIFEGEVIEDLFEGNHLYNLKGTWTLETGPSVRQMYDIGETFPFEFYRALGDPFERELFLGIGRVQTLTLNYKNGQGKINCFPSVTLSRARGVPPPSSPALGRESVELNGSWGYGPSHGGDYYRVDAQGGRLTVTVSKLDRNHRELLVGDKAFEGTMEADPQNPNLWKLTGKAIRRPFSGNEPPEFYDTTGTIRLHKRKADGAVLAILTLVRKYGDSSAPGEWVVYRVVRS